MKYALPAWLLEAVGEPRPTNFLWTDSKRFIISYVGRPNRFYETAEEAYYSVGDEPIRLDPSLTNAYGVYFGAVRNDGSSALLVSRTDEAILEELEDSLFRFINTTYMEYYRAPNDFLNAYNFIAHHPALWLRARPDEPPVSQHWATDGGVSAVKLYPQAKNAGGHNFVVNLYERVEPEFTITAFDPMLSDQSPSYDEAIITVAAVLHNRFHPTGERRSKLNEHEATEQFLQIATQHKKNLQSRVTSGSFTL